jgi:hypothetical protein
VRIRRVAVSGAGLLVALGLGGADCAPGLVLAEAADCCTCLARTTLEGGSAAVLDDNCLPNDASTTNGVVDAEESACAAGAGEAINGTGAIFVEPVCLDAPHPCAEVCAAANAEGPIFVDRAETP